MLDQAIQLAQLPHYCVWANSLSRARQLLREILPDVILIDYNMPVSNGMDCLRIIRDMHHLDKTQVILYSNFLSDTTRELAMKQGASCLQKPGSIQQLAEFLSKLNGGDKTLQPHL